jgi:hypothetical protein
LDESKDSVEQYDGQDGRRIEPVFQETRDNRGPDQHPDNETRKLGEKEPQQGRGLSFRQFVGAFSLEPLLGLVFGQASIDAGLEPFRHSIWRTRIPRSNDGRCDHH